MHGHGRAVFEYELALTERDALAGPGHERRAGDVGLADDGTQALDGLVRDPSQATGRVDVRRVDAPPVRRHAP